MNQIKPTEMVKLMDGVALDSVVFVSYIAGRTGGTQATKESARAVEEGVSLRHYTGLFKGIRVTRRGEPVMTLWVEERDSPRRDGTLKPGAFRVFNPCLGKLLTLQVVEGPVLQAQQATA